VKPDRSSKSTRGRVGIIHLRGDFDTIPALRSAVTLLIGHGYAVDVMYVRDPAFLPPRLEAGATLYALPRLPRRIRPTALRRGIEMLLWFFLALRYCTGRSYTCLIGIDPTGLILSALLAFILRTSYAYASLELYLWDELTAVHMRLMKRLERFVNRRCWFSIVQDQERARLLIAENRLAPDTVVLLPNSPLGPPTRGPSHYLHDKLHIPVEKRLILYAGALAEWTYTPELIASARDWPLEWVLVMHSRQRGNDIGLDPINYPWVKWSSQPVPYEELPALIASAAVGLVLYRNADTVWQGKNMTHVGLSSGKLAQYLRSGVPVVVLAFPGLCEIVERYHCGVCVKDVVQLPDAIATVLANHDHYVEGAASCFAEEFAFERHFAAVLTRLDEAAL
jgi:glycosyltransferase involved in cell wall biosynthesis